MLSISVWRLCFFQMNPSACHDVPHVFFWGIDSARTCSWWKQCCLIMNLERWHFFAGCFILMTSMVWYHFSYSKKTLFSIPGFKFFCIYIYYYIYIGIVSFNNFPDCVGCLGPSTSSTRNGWNFDQDVEDAVLPTIEDIEDVDGQMLWWRCDACNRDPYDAPCNLIS